MARNGQPGRLPESDGKGPGKALAPRRDYSEEEITDGLTALALYNGSAAAAARELERQERPIPKSTLQRWKELYDGRYMAVQEKVLPAIWARTSDGWRKVAENGAKATDEAIDKGRAAIEEGDSKRANEWGSAARNYATAGGISNDKARVIDGEPTERTAPQADMASILRAAAQFLPSIKESPLYGAYVLESTAEELPDPGSMRPERPPGERAEDA